MTGLHPATLLAGWLLTALVLQFLPLVPLSLVALLAATSLQFREPGAVLHSLRRMKWLLLALLLVMAWSVPGKALVGAVWSPTLEGLMAGGSHALRILVLVWTIRLIWLDMGQDGVLAGVYCLLRPLCVLGVPVERAGLRLGLTLAYAEKLLAESPGFSWDNWRRELFGVAQAMPDRVELKLYRGSWRDMVCILLILVVSGILMKVWA